MRQAEEHARASLGAGETVQGAIYLLDAAGDVYAVPIDDRTAVVGWLVVAIPLAILDSMG